MSETLVTPSDSIGTVSILHVEDDPDFRELTATILRQEDDRIRIDTASSAEEGVRKLTENEYDCIVSDYDMPGKNGIEFLERVRTESAALPFILFTGKGSEEVASEAITAGVTDYLQKQGGISQYTVLANRIENAVEQYHSKRALEASQKRLSLFIEQSPLGVIEWDEQFEIVRLNDAAEAILGYRQEELMGDSWERIVPESDRGTVSEVVAELLEAEGGFHSVNENLRADGERIVCEWHNRVVTDEHGDVVAIFSQFQNVTERREETQQLQTVVDNLPGFVYRHRTDSGWPLEFVKGSVQEVTGYTATELETEVHFAEEIIHPEDHEYVRSETERQLEDTGRYDLTYRIRTRGGETRWIWERGTVIEDPVTGEEKLEGFISDVTEHKEREHELRHSKARLKALFDESPDMIHIHDREGNLIDPNPRLCEKTGYSEAELTEMKVWDLDHSITPDEAAALWEGMNLGDSERVEGRYQCRDGSTFPVEVHLRRLDLNGECHFVASSRDISERKTREGTLEKQRTVLSTIIENLPVGVLVEDESRNILATNSELAEIFGFDDSPADLVGTNCDRAAQDIKHVCADPEGFIESIAERIESRTPVTGEEIVLADGRILERDYIPYDLPEGGANLWVYYDVTVDREQQKLLSGLFEESLDGIGVKEIVTDENGNPIDYVYRRVNDRFEELTGLAAKAVVGRRATEVLDGIEETPFIEVFGEVALGGEPVRFEQFSEPLGMYYEVSAFSPRHGQVITIFSDITDRKEREHALRRERDRLDEFASILSHDLRNPLNVAQLRLDLAQRTCECEHLDDVDRALHRMEVLITDLLTLARHGEMVSDVESVDIEQLLTECWQSVETTTAELVVDIDATLLADRSRLQQLLENLIRNSVEHGSTNGQTGSDNADHGSTDVTVTVGELSDGFFLEDDGSGIPETERETVFDAGYSIRDEGTGFGLAIVKQVANAHGWDIRLTDGSNGGARFEITGVEFES